MLKNELWVLYGVIYWGLDMDLLKKIAQRYNEMGTTPDGYRHKETISDVP